MSQISHRMMQINGGDCRRIAHAHKVWALCATLGGMEGLGAGEMRVLEAAALLHDIGIRTAEREYGSAAGPLQERLGPPIARAILDTLRMDPAETERVCHLIGHHHTYSAVDGRDFRLLVEADLLVNIHEEGWGTERVDALRRHFVTSSGRALLDCMFPPAMA